MQSRLATTAMRFNRLLCSGTGKPPLTRRLGSGTNTGRTAVHAVDQDVRISASCLYKNSYQEVYPDEAYLDEKLRQRQEPEPISDSKDNETYVPPKSPIESVPKLEFTGVRPRTDPIGQQKRKFSSKRDEFICAGLDGSPWPAGEEEIDREKQRIDDIEYFKHHKASPLSEIEFADTRKPITQATDGTVQNITVGYEGTGTIVWRPEQVDTAEDSLRRATEVFKMNAMRGDPESPHGRVLRELRGEVNIGE